MKPTTEQLNDPKWWDENAPEGATHYTSGGAPNWYKRAENWQERDLENEFDYWFHHESVWVESSGFTVDKSRFDDLTPRPESPKTEAQRDWDDEHHDLSTFFTKASGMSAEGLADGVLVSGYRKKINQEEAITRIKTAAILEGVQVSDYLATAIAKSLGHKE